MHIIDGKKIRNDILEKLKKDVATLPFVPVFCDILVGDNSESIQYVRMKRKYAESVGIKFHTANFEASISTSDLIKEINKLNKYPNMCGIIVQLPLPSHLDRQAILDSINPEMDVDCLGKIKSDKFYRSYDKEKDLCPPTALSCMALLDSIGLDLRTKKIVVLGYGALVGKPVYALLKYYGLNAEIVEPRTEHKEDIVKKADVIISGIGKGRYLSGDLIKSGSVLIDAGTTESDGGIVGDVDLASVKNIAGFISPVPGGVGPVTVAMLLQNVFKVAKNRIQD